MQLMTVSVASTFPETLLPEVDRMVSNEFDVTSWQSAYSMRTRSHSGASRLLAMVFPTPCQTPLDCRSPGF